MVRFRLGPSGAIAVADHILVLAHQDGITLDPLQLNKLCYITQGFCLGKSKKPAFDNSIEAWKYGPVVKSVYNKFKQYRRCTITHLSDTTPLNDVRRCPTPEIHAESVDLSDHVTEAARQVVSKYGKYSGIKLLDMTHYEGTPWYAVYSPDSNNVIPKELIQKHYLDIVVTQPDGGL